VSGATEESARRSAEGVVQHLNYKATFPILLNISGEITYFMALKDSASLVKMYAMVNVQQFQIVGTGTSVAACEVEYIRQLRQNGILSEAGAFGSREEDAVIEGRIAEIRSAVRGGESFFYFRLEGDDIYYAISAAESELAIILNVGDRVAVHHDPVISDNICRAYVLTLQAGNPRSAGAVSGD